MPQSIHETFEIAGMLQASSLKSHIAQSDQGETEDEEVKQHCILGYSGLRDSDFSDTNTDDEGVKGEGEDDRPGPDDAMEGDLTDSEKLVQFISRRQTAKPEGLILYRPTPITPKLAGHVEASEEDTGSASSCDFETFKDIKSNGFKKTASSQALRDDDLPVVFTVRDEQTSAWDPNVDHLPFRHKNSYSSFELKRLLHEKNEDETDNLQENQNADIEYVVDTLGVANSFGSDRKKGDHGHTPESDEESNVLLGGSVDDKWTLSKQKRVLSSNTLAVLNHEASRYADFPKRSRCLAASDLPCSQDIMSLNLVGCEQTTLSHMHGNVRNDTPFLTSDDEDNMLSEELEQGSKSSGGENSPIPLLTPPQSPIRDDEVEWPSNLVVDSAWMNTVTELRPLSPASLQTMEEEEEQRLMGHNVESSTLSPLLRSIYVGTV